MAEHKDHPVHVNPSHKGRFHRWLGKSQDEPITEADIAEGLASKDPAVRLMARFAKISKKWHHPGAK